MEFERRSFPLQDVEIRAAADGRISFRGLAATYGDWSKNLGGFVEKIEPSAFTRALSEGQDVPFLVNHDRNLFLGRTGTGTVKLSSTERGLLVEAESLPDTQAARDLKALGGEIRSMSFGFKVPKGGDSWDWAASPAQRSLRDVDLGDVSVLTGAVPAYNDTTAEVRALVEAHQGEVRRQYTTEQKAELAKKGQAIPVKNDKGEIIDGRYPIADTEDLSNAIQAFGRASDQAEVKAWIIKRARALGATDQLPDDWRSLVDAAEIAEFLRVQSERLAEFDERAGAVLSKVSKSKISNAMSAMKEAHSHLEQLMADAGDGPTVADSSDTFDIEMASLGRRVRLAAARCGDRVDTRSEQAEREPAA